MKSASTPENTEKILYDIVNGSASHPIALLKYLDTDTSTLTELEDVTAFNNSTSNTNELYQKFITVPPANTLSATIDNDNDKYSPDAGGTLSGKIKRNTIIEASYGYALSEKQLDYHEHTAGTDAETLYHTKVILGKISNNSSGIGSYTALPGINFNIYDTGIYDQGFYSPEGYYLSKVIDLDSTQEKDEAIQFVLDSDTTKIDIWVRYASAPDPTGDFQFIGSSAVGNKVLDIFNDNFTHFQFALVFRTGEWGTGYAENIKVGYLSTMKEYFSQGFYLVDKVSFPVSNGNYKLSISCRDYFKKAYETNITCPSYTSLTDVNTILSDICKRCAIGYVGTATGNEVIIADDDNFKDIQGIKALDEVMQYLISKEPNYRLEPWLNGVRLSLKDATINNADWQLDYRFNIQTMNRVWDSDNLVQRVEVSSKDIAIKPETLLDSDTYATDDTRTLSWAVNSIKIRIEVTGTIEITNLTRILQKSIIFTQTGAGDVLIYGCEVDDSSYTTGSFIEVDNFEGMEGGTPVLINRLVQTDGEARIMAKQFVTNYGNPEWKITATIPANPLLELGDKLLVWDRFTNTESIFRLDTISPSFRASGANLSQNLTLTDLGTDLENYIYDRNYYREGIRTGVADIFWDKGLIWDWDLGATATEDPANYDDRKKVRTI